MEETRIKYLLEQYQHNQLTEVERDELLQITMSEKATLLKSELIALIAANAQIPEFEDKKVIDAAFMEMMNADKYMVTADRKPVADSLRAALPSYDNIRTVHRVHFLKTAWFRYAAILLLIAGVGSFLYLNNRTSHHEIVQQQPPDIMPGSDKAMLTLAGGEQIRLDSSANLLLASKGISNDDAVVRYVHPPEIPTINLLTTPRGGQYKVQLSDGTMVWLNAASSISYPTVFTERKREVTVTGEVYFEVAPDKTRPFMVKTPTDEVQVLGTSFNINAYADEPGVKTSLLEGIVKVGTTILKAGEEYTNGKVIASNTAQDIAWKSGFISFEGRPLDQVMREIARWYDVDVVYQQGVPDVQLGGKMSRDVSLSGMIANLEAIEVHVKLQGRRITVLPK